MGDFFSKQSSVYAQSRPSYPNELFTFLSELCVEHQLAWDCATGNGQAAVSLASHFDKVIASDLSEKQISNATPAPNVEYRVHRVEANTLEDSSVDLITVATAAHFFDLPVFYAEVDRILKPRGVLAIWSYAGCKVNEEVDPVLDEFAFEFLHDHWPEQTRYNWKDKYKTLPFPYSQVDLPKFEASQQYNWKQLESYLNSWSGVQAFISEKGTNPVDIFRERFENAWGNLSEVRTVRWPLFMKCGRKKQVDSS